MCQCETQEILYILFVAHYNGALELRVGGFTMAENKSSALIFISFNMSMKYLKRKKKS